MWENITVRPDLAKNEFQAHVTTIGTHGTVWHDRVAEGLGLIFTPSGVESPRRRRPLPSRQFGAPVAAAWSLSGWIAFPNL